MKGTLRVLFLIFVFQFQSLANNKLFASPLHPKENKKAQQYFDLAHKAYMSHNYQKAETNAKKAIAADSAFVDAYLLLSDISDELQNQQQQLWSLGHIVALQPGKYPLAHKLVANLSLKKGDYQKALANYTEYKSKAPASDSAWIEMQIACCKFGIEQVEKGCNDINIAPLPRYINTATYEYWPSLPADDSTLYFTRLLRSPRGFSYERIFSSHLIDKGFELPEELQISDGEMVNEGTMCISSDQKMLFFTACGRTDGLGSCDIYYSIKQNGHWALPKNCGYPVNGSSWETQPSVSADGHYLYFCSQRKGGFGGMDIWRCKMSLSEDESLQFDTPENLGGNINTPADDYSPFIHADGTTLYFASTGRVGLGGSDIFVSKFVNGTWQQPKNLGFPINTWKNEDGMAVSATTSKCIFSSNRDEAVDGSKDLFTCQLPDSLQPNWVGYVKGFVFNKDSGTKLNAKIVLTNTDDGSSQTILADRNDGYLVTLKSGKSYAFNIEEPGYLFYSEIYDMKQAGTVKQSTTKNIQLEPIEVGQSITLKNIFFDYDSFKLKEGSKAELNRVIMYLDKNPTIKVEIAGHTDNQGSEEYNQKLSTKRAEAIVQYLSAKVDKNRLTAKGYGAKVPLMPNDTEEGRAQNRRSVLTILSK